MVEAMLGTFVPRDGKVLILVDGAYGQRMAKICEVAGRRHVLLETAEDRPVDPRVLDRGLAGDAEISHVAVVQCETTSGIVNPLEAIARVCAARSRGLLVDAMSSFGALPLDARTTPFEALAAASGKCLESTPGLGFCIARRDALERTRGNAHALSLDLCDQYLAMERDGQWRFTPPVQTILSLDRALDEFEAEGGVAARRKRYEENLRILVGGMRRLGFETLLPDAVQAPIIVTFHMPADPRFAFEGFYERMRCRGYVIYPGKLTAAPRSASAASDAWAQPRCAVRSPRSRASSKRWGFRAVRPPPGAGSTDARFAVSVPPVNAPDMGWGTDALSGVWDLGPEATALAPFLLPVRGPDAG